MGTKQNPTPCTPEIYRQVIDDLIAGIPLAQQLDINKDNLAFPTRTGVMNYINADNARKAEYAQAREDCADAMADQVVIVSDSNIDPQRANNRMKSRQWLAAKLKPKVYGDKLDLEVTGRIDIQAAMLAARARTQMIDVTPESTFITSDTQSDDDTSVLESNPAVDPFS